MNGREDKNISVLSGRDARSDERHTPAAREWSMRERHGRIEIDGPPGTDVARVPFLRRGAGRGMPVRYTGQEKLREVAAFIVTACNSHDDMREALSELIYQFEADQIRFTENANIPRRQSLVRLRAILAKASATSIASEEQDEGAQRRSTPNNLASKEGR